MIRLSCLCATALLLAGTVGVLAQAPQNATPQPQTGVQAPTELAIPRNSPAIARRSSGSAPAPAKSTALAILPAQALAHKTSAPTLAPAMRSRHQAALTGWSAAHLADVTAPDRPRTAMTRSGVQPNATAASVRRMTMPAVPEKALTRSRMLAALPLPPSARGPNAGKTAAAQHKAKRNLPPSSFIPKARSLRRTG